jgi:energy-coupling factor transporter ATP-binding protein EcfA2
MRIRLNKFCPSPALQNHFIVVIGKRGCGKSVLLRDLACRIVPDADMAFCVCPTDECNNTLSCFVPSTLVHPDVDEVKLASVMNKQKQHVMAARVKGVKPRQLVMIFDDFAFATKIWKSKAFEQIAFNGRHLHITVFVTLQYAMLLPPEIRSNVDTVCVLAENVLANRKRLYEQYFGVVDDFDTFNKIMTRCTNNYEALVLNTRNNSTDIHELLFWYRADVEGLNGQLMGSKKLRAMSDYYSSSLSDTPGSDGPTGSRREDDAEESGMRTVIGDVQ